MAETSSFIFKGDSWKSHHLMNSLLTLLAYLGNAVFPMQFHRTEHSVKGVDSTTERSGTIVSPQSTFMCLLDST